MLFLFKTTLMFIERVDLILMSEKFSPVVEFIDMQGNHFDAFIIERKQMNVDVPSWLYQSEVLFRMFSPAWFRRFN